MQIKAILPIALLTAFAAADFQIWSITDIYASDGIGGGGVVNQGGFAQFNSDPSCDDANHATMFAGNDDLSGDHVDAYRCSGCGFEDPASYAVTELEWKTAQGHYTIYGRLLALRLLLQGANCATEDAGYQITPADGSRLRGYCVRDSGDTLQCSFGPGDNYQGTRLFQCYSDLTAVDFV